MGWLRRAPEPEYSVLMVCMGNICRSPTAEGVLRHRLQAAGLATRVRVDSAGTYGAHAGQPPDPRACQAALRRGIDLSRQRARKVDAADFGRFQLLLAMDADNLAALQRLRPDPQAPAPQLLMAWARDPAAPSEVPDPYYGGPDGFERVIDLIDDACGGLVDHIAQQLQRPPSGTS